MPTFIQGNGRMDVFGEKQGDEDGFERWGTKKKLKKQDTTRGKSVRGLSLPENESVVMEKAVVGGHASTRTYSSNRKGRAEGGRRKM